METFEKFLGVPFPILWVVAAILVPVAMIVSSLRDWAKLPGCKCELRHFIAYMFTAVAGVLLVNSVVLFNYQIFHGNSDGWSLLPFAGAIVCTVVASISRYGL